MAVLTLVFLVCSFRVNVIFVLLLIGGEIAFSLLAASLFVESEALRLLGNGQALQAAGNAAEAAPLLLAGENRLKIALRLTTVSMGLLDVLSFVDNPSGWRRRFLRSNPARVVFTVVDYVSSC